MRHAKKRKHIYGDKTRIYGFSPGAYGFADAAKREDAPSLSLRCRRDKVGF